MKTSITKIFGGVAALLALGGPLFAHIPVAGSNSITHAHLEFKTVLTVFTVVDPVDKEIVTVQWEAQPACPEQPDPYRYKVSITRKPDGGQTLKKKVFSMWTLGLQSLDRYNRILKDSGSGGGTVQFASSVYGQLFPRDSTKDQVIGPAGTITTGSPPKPVVNEAQIWLIELTGDTFAFDIESILGARVARTKWYDPDNLLKCADAEGHDNEPPENPPR
jgi:hypothetical protein